MIDVDGKLFFMQSNHSNKKEKLNFAKSIFSFLHIKQLKNLNSRSDILDLF